MLPEMTDLGPITQAKQVEKTGRSQYWQADNAEHAAAERKAVEQAKAAPPGEEPKARTGTNTTSVRLRAKDSLELSFHLTQEERDAMVKAFSKDEALTEEERSTVQSTSERITKAIEEALSKRTENAERVEKAVSKWYSKIAQGEEREPLELIKLLRMASLGQLDLPGA